MTLSPLKSLFPPWNLPNWRQVDDSVRGGSSTSFLSEFSDSEGEHSVIFHGILGESASNLPSPLVSLTKVIIM